MSEDSDLNTFFIVRKRKKYKFAKFASSPLCFEFEEWEKTRVNVVEVGAGTGLFSVELARRYPKKTFVAVDVKADRLQKGAYEASEKGLSNIRFVRARADQLVHMFEPESVESIWLTFSDPFPRKRSAGRRMTHPTFLSTYTKTLTVDGSLYVKHDDTDFFQWSLEQLVACNWRIDELAFDLHDSSLSDDYKLMTTYEERWLGEDRTTKFVKAYKGENV